MSETKYLKTAVEIKATWGDAYADLAELLDTDGIRFPSPTNGELAVEIELLQDTLTDEGKVTRVVLFRQPKGGDLIHAGEKHPNPVAMQMALAEICTGLSWASLREMDTKSLSRIMQVAAVFF